MTAEIRIEIGIYPASVRTIFFLPPRVVTRAGSRFNLDIGNVKKNNRFDGVDPDLPLSSTRLVCLHSCEC